MRKFIAAAVFVSIGLYLLAAPEARAEGSVVCSIRVSNVANDTQQMTDAGTVCPWAAGSAVPMQCGNAKVCYEPGALDRLSDGGRQQLLVMNLEADGGRGPTDGGVLADGGAVSSTSARGPYATVNSLCANFLATNGNPDPYIIYLDGTQRNISLILAEAGDGGTTADCKFANSKRRIQ